MLNFFQQSDSERDTAIRFSVWTSAEATERWALLPAAIQTTSGLLWWTVVNVDVGFGIWFFIQLFLTPVRKQVTGCMGVCAISDIVLYEQRRYHIHTTKYIPISLLLIRHHLLWSDTLSNLRYFCIQLYLPVSLPTDQSDRSMALPPHSKNCPDGFIASEKICFQRCEHREAYLIDGG